jgi:hypothetical protein
MAPGEERRRVLEAYTGMVAGSPVRQSHPAGWLWHAQVLLSRLRAAAALGLLQELRASGDGVLAFYQTLDQVAPEPRPVCSEAGVCPPMTGPDAMRAELLSALLN